MSAPFTELKDRWGITKAIGAKLLQTFSHRTGIHFAYLFVRAIDGKLVPPQLPDGYSLKILSAAEVMKFADQPELDLPGEFLLAAEARGDYCVVAFFGDQPVSYVWRGYHSTNVQQGITLNFAHPIRYGYKALTLAAHRGLRLQQSLTLHSDQTDMANGYEFALSYIELHNYASIASDKRRGNVVVGYICWGSNRLFKLGLTTPGGRRRGITLSKE